MSESNPVQSKGLVWYVSYGSNLSRERFMCYIAGGTPRGSNRRYTGCRDKRPPLDDQPCSLNFNLYFADYSKSWHGAVAFLACGNKDSVALGRMYLITDDQFNDVVLQENERPVDGRQIIPSFETLRRESESVLLGIRLYGSLLHVGDKDSHPVLTFTATKGDFPIAPPSEAYLRLIVAGLEETYPCMKKREIRDYLSVAPGIHDKIPIEQLTRWILDK